MVYLITFTGYGCHLHGDESGSVDRGHNLPASRLIEADPGRAFAERLQMDQPPYRMDRIRQEAVLAALLERCSLRHWNLLAAHERVPRAQQSRSHRDRSGDSPGESHEWPQVLCQPLLEPAGAG